MEHPHEGIVPKSNGHMDKHRDAWQKTEPHLTLRDPRLQVLLATHAFPDSQDPMMDWLTKDVDGATYSLRFGGYRNEFGYDTIRDVSTEEEVEKLLGAVKVHASDDGTHETRH